MTQQNRIEEQRFDRLEARKTLIAGVAEMRKQLEIYKSGNGVFLEAPEGYAMQGVTIGEAFASLYENTEKLIDAWDQIINSEKWELIHDDILISMIRNKIFSSDFPNMWQVLTGEPKVQSLQELHDLRVAAIRLLAAMFDTASFVDSYMQESEQEDREQTTQYVRSFVRSYIQYNLGRQSLGDFIDSLEAMQMPIDLSQKLATALAGVAYWLQIESTDKTQLVCIDLWANVFTMLGVDLYIFQMSESYEELKEVAEGLDSGYQERVDRAKRFTDLLAEQGQDPDEFRES